MPLRSLTLLALLAISAPLKGNPVAEPPLSVTEVLQVPSASFAIGFNYYPRGRLWRDFWQNFDLNVVAGDFQAMSVLGAKVVRIFVHHEYFTAEETKESGRKKLGQLLDAAQASGLKLIVTLFDWSQPYAWMPSSKSEDVKHIRDGLEILVKTFGKHPALYIWDLKNEPDHDFVTAGRHTVAKWLDAALSAARRISPTGQFTVGWLWLFADLRVNRELDVLSFHHFPEQGVLAERIARFKAMYPRHPILLEEVGMSTSRPGIERLVQEAEQKQFLQSALADALGGGLSGMLIWNMHDHPNNVGPKRPPAEDGFGIYRVDGSAKPSAELFQSAVFVSSCEHPPLKTGSARVCALAGPQGGSLTASGLTLKAAPGWSCYCLVKRPETPPSESDVITLTHTGLMTLSGQAYQEAALKLVVNPATGAYRLASP